MPSKWVSVTGSRTYPVTAQQWEGLSDNEKLECIAKGSALVRVNIDQFPDDWGIVSGGAKGPDSWAQQIALDRGLEFVLYEAEWDKYGKGAGKRRNGLIARHADGGCLVFWDGVSRGTSDFIRKAFRLRRDIWVIGPTGTPWAIWDAEFWGAHPEKNPRMDIPRG